MNGIIKDSTQNHWVNRSPASIRPFLQLSRLDRPVGYWLLALPGWIGIAFAGLTDVVTLYDIVLAALILIGAIAMRGAGCTYNDIVDQDLDARVARTALRPLPAGTVTTRAAWLWLLAQCGVGLIVLLCLPRLAQIIALCSLPLVAAYPFMKRITWFPQVWLGMTFNWAVLVAYAATTGEISGSLILLYVGLIFWTIGYDTIYACQDIEDDGMIGIKSTARRFGHKVRPAVALIYALAVLCIIAALWWHLPEDALTPRLQCSPAPARQLPTAQIWSPLIAAPFAALLWFQVHKLKDQSKALSLFKFNGVAGLILVLSLLLTVWLGYQPKFNFNVDSIECMRL